MMTISSSFGVQVITLDEVAKHVKKSNFKVLENAQRVYQAKESINFAKRNLLPKLNFWNVITRTFDWRSAVGIVQDVAPFLVPANWFRVGQSRYLYLAQEEQYRALWANEVMTAKLLFLNTLRDINFKENLLEQYNQFDELVGIAESRVIFGEIPPQTLKYLKIRKLELEEDLRVVENVVFEERKALGLLLAMPQEKEVNLMPIELPVVEDLTPLKFDTFVFRALDNAPEIIQYKYLNGALDYVRREITFSFLGASTISQSSGGGVFSHIPIQDGLGFGMTSSLRISRSEREILKINKEATGEVIKKNLYLLVNNYNSFIANINNQKERYELAQSNYEVMRSQLLLGMNVDPIAMMTTLENLFDAKITIANYKYEVVTVMEKIRRIIFDGDYTKKETQLEDLIHGGGK